MILANEERITYLFELDQLEDLHETINLVVQFLASTQKLLQVVNVGTISRRFKLGEL